MRKITRAGAVVVAAAAATTIALPAGAATTHHGWDDEGDGDGAGLIEVCNHSSYLFNVYADGPSIRKDDLAGSFDECTHWSRVRPGRYDIGFGLQTASAQRVIIQARVKRDGQTFYKVFNNEDVISSNVGPHSLTRVDLFIPQG
jgi:hypothetical protein